MPTLISKSDSRYKIIADVAGQLGINPDWLSRQIAFESGYNPKIHNPTPGSSAIGLIQLTNIAAKQIGYADSTVAISQYPDFESQMWNVVLPYLKSVARMYPNPANPAVPFPDEKSLYMGIFYPAWRFKSASTVFPADVQKWNPGIVTIQDYIDLLYGKKSAGVPVSRPDATSGMNLVLILIVIGLVGYIAWPKK